MSKDTDSPSFVSINEDVAATLLIYLNENNNKDYEKQDIVTNTYFEAIVPLINKLFNQRLVYFVNKIEFSDPKQNQWDCSI